MKTMAKLKGSMAYVLVPIDEPDFEEFARRWCEQRGWRFVSIERQERVSEERFMLGDVGEGAMMGKDVCPIHGRWVRFQDEVRDCPEYHCPLCGHDHDPAQTCEEFRHE